jgi:hypothetical protein
MKKRLTIILTPIFLMPFLSFSQFPNKSINVEPNCNKGQMSYNINECGAYDIPALQLPGIKNEFIILVKPELKIRNFVSIIEKYKRSQSVNVDTSGFYLIKKNWKRLSAEEKIEVIKNEKIINRIEADSIHKVNNSNHQMVYIANYTDHYVAVQMQDWSFICILEAIDKNKEWKPIQFWSFSKCGNSYNLKNFAPKTANYFIAPQINSGDYKTSLRYKLLGNDGFYYSNTFTGNINYCQFFEENPRTDQYRAYKLEDFRQICDL